MDGSLPTEIGNLKSLSLLDISNNNPSGEIPSSISDCNSLEHLNMGLNLLEGTIPQSFTLLKGLQDLDLSLNNLSGQIPKDLKKLSALKSLNLPFNNLEPEVPTKGIFGNTNVIFVNENDKLCGGMAKLQLPTCTNCGPMKQEKSNAFRIVLEIISVVLGLLLISSFITLYWISKSKSKPPSTPLIGDKLLKLSYKELFQATGGFSSNNFIGFRSFGSVYKGIIDQDFKALVYEFMPNGSLDDWLHLPMETHGHSGNLSLLQRLNIAIDVASALDYLHYHCCTTIVHCDLKPSNILLDSDMTAHVSDFGLARLLLETDDNSSRTQPSTIGTKGSIGYVALGKKNKLKTLF
ncbi:probable LRR receptor-like serine/threonine-protein kinase At3g47570 [Macadamia integrifolia]|uniref:probable LRR receptor-like serine/threonine-protein kinase At3g47570 n=1 Tax=Macadamia integrifolia TaxID=60698 RepID=UPI001C4FA5B7|nr:probable LRR receptor-like serine/threonine-protein kinase At3g47570 [Macadamia integrifolia]